MNNRDWNYIEGRLLAPAVEVNEAVGRLRQVGMKAEADHLMEALKTFTDECRYIRNLVRRNVKD